MISIRSVYVIISVAFLAFHAHAQSNFKKGYVVTNTGDTLRGFIDHKEWSRNPRFFSFKKSTEDNTVTEFNTHGVRYFGVETDEYLRYEGQISMDKNSMRAADVLALKYSSDTVFLKVITKGKFVTLSSYRDELKYRFFLSFSTEVPEELIYRLYPDETQTNQLVVDDRYKSALLQAAQRAGVLTDNIRWMIRKSTYGTQSIAEIVNKINGVTETVVSRRKKKATHFFAGLGVNRSDWQFSNVQGYYITSTPTYGPYFAAGFSHLPNPDVGKLVFRTEISVGVTSPVIHTTYYQISDNTFTQCTVSLSPSLLYNFYNTEKTKVYLGAGFKFNRSYYSKNDYTTTTGINFVPIWFSFSIQAGILINQKTELVASYIPQWGEYLANFDPWAQSVTYTRIGVNYHFDIK